MRIPWKLFVAAGGLLLAGCYGISSADEPAGRLEGVLLLEWSREDGFIYTPDPTNPLRYHRADREPLIPGRMATDGGSIPRIFWSVKGFSPWSYAPAYMLHDWIFREHRCGRNPPPQGYTFEQSTDVMDDVILILIKEGKAASNGEARRLIKWTVDKFGREAWDGPCVPDLAVAARGDAIVIQRFDFDSGQ